MPLELHGPQLHQPAPTEITLQQLFPGVGAARRGPQVLPDAAGTRCVVPSRSSRPLVCSPWRSTSRAPSSRPGRPGTGAVAWRSPRRPCGGGGEGLPPTAVRPAPRGPGRHLPRSRGAGGGRSPARRGAQGRAEGRREELAGDLSGLWGPFRLQPGGAASPGTAERGPRNPRASRGASRDSGRASGRLEPSRTPPFNAPCLPCENLPNYVGLVPRGCHLRASGP